MEGIASATLLLCALALVGYMVLVVMKQHHKNEMDRLELQWSLNQRKQRAVELTAAFEQITDLQNQLNKMHKELDEYKSRVDALGMKVGFKV